MTLKELVKDKKVQFAFYRKGELWYNVLAWDYEDPHASNGWRVVYAFPVPIADTGDGTFLPEDKAMLYMRYIRKQLEAEEKEKINEGEETYKEHCA